MAVNKPTGDNSRKGAVRRRSQLKTKIQGERDVDETLEEDGPVHRSEEAPAKKKFKGVRREKKAA